MHKDYQLLELIEKDRLDEILSSFTQVTGVSSFIVTPGGQPVSDEYNWSRLCSDYCRSTEEGKRLCCESDRNGAEMSAKLKKRVSYTCLNAGLIDCTSPIIVGHYHIASFMCGQVLYSPIDESTAKENARKIGIEDTAGYIQALKSVPIISPERLSAIVNFMEVVTKTISELAWNKYVSLKQSRRYIDQIVNRVSDGIISIDTQGRISMVNEAFVKAIGFSRQSIVGQYFSKFIADDDSLGVYEKTLRTVREKGHDRAAINITDADNRKISVSVSFDRAGQKNTSPSFVAVLRDVSEEQKIAALKEDLIGMMTHDLGNPIFSIQKAMELLSSGVLGPLNPEQEELIKLSKSTTQQLSLMVMDYMDIYRHENGKLRLRKEVLDMRSIVRESIKQAELLTAEKAISICYPAPPDELNVMGDRLRLTRICLNLIGNAIKFSPVGGKIVVSTRYESNGDGMLCKRCQKCADAQMPLPEPGQKYMLMEITDQGPGIERSFKGTIFDKFSTVGGKDVNGRGGVGLGLSFCKLAVEAHRGFIGFESPIVPETSGKGNGSRFFVALPADVKVRFDSVKMEF